MSQGAAFVQQVPLEQQVRELELMVQISRTLTSTLDLDRLLELIINRAGELVGSVGASIILQNRRTGSLIFRAATGPKSEDLLNQEVPIENSIAGTVFQTCEPLIVQEIEADPRHYDGTDRAIEFETQSILAVPMIFKERTIGVLEAVNKQNQDLFNEHDAQILSTLAAQAAVAIENARLVHELQQANVQLAQLDELKSNFIAIASHELRTPLGLIMGYATFLREEADSKSGEQLDLVLESAQQLRDLIESMVNLTHLKSGSVSLDLADFNLQSVVQETIEIQSQFADTKSLKIILSLPSVSTHVCADREKITIVLNNLLNNAIKFTPAGGRIQIAVRPQTGAVAVSVADTGIGIPEHELERIFDRFHQVEPHLTRKHGGMGLGLSIAGEIVKLHGGRIWAESVLGRGSRFTFTLPTLLKHTERA
jgi:signal transduction histidine kinase